MNHDNDPSTAKKYERASSRRTMFSNHGPEKRKRLQIAAEKRDNEIGRKISSSLLLLHNRPPIYITILHDLMHNRDILEGRNSASVATVIAYHCAKV